MEIDLDLKSIGGNAYKAHAEVEHRPEWREQHWDLFTMMNYQEVYQNRDVEVILSLYQDVEINEKKWLQHHMHYQFLNKRPRIGGCYYIGEMTEKTSLIAGLEIPTHVFYYPFVLNRASMQLNIFWEWVPLTYYFEVTLYFKPKSKPLFYHYGN